MKELWKNEQIITRKREREREIQIILIVDKVTVITLLTESDMHNLTQMIQFRIVVHIVFPTPKIL